MHAGGGDERVLVQDGRENLERVEFKFKGGVCAVRILSLREAVA
jgi:hypothetical protein